jgi:hypothetical protein
MIKKFINKSTIIIASFLCLILIIFAALQVKTLRKAHSSFDNYYNFRGCVQLIKRTPTYGICKTSNGNTIKIVLYKGKWYLDGDLPIGIWGHLN